MGWTISFAPVLGWPLIAVSGGHRPLPDRRIGLCAGPRLAAAQRWRWRCSSLALANPSIRNEEREALTDIAVAVIDRSQSQEGGNRPGQTDAAEAALQAARWQRLGNTELRVVDVRSGITAADDGTRLFEALNQALCRHSARALRRRHHGHRRPGP